MCVRRCQFLEVRVLGQCNLIFEPLPVGCWSKAIFFKDLVPSRSSVEESERMTGAESNLSNLRGRGGAGER